MGLSTERKDGDRYSGTVLLIHLYFQSIQAQLIDLKSLEQFENVTRNTLQIVLPLGVRGRFKGFGMTTGSIAPVSWFMRLFELG